VEATRGEVLSICSRGNGSQVVPLPRQSATAVTKSAAENSIVLHVHHGSDWRILPYEFVLALSS
jgi:hypothetical protein